MAVRDYAVVVDTSGPLFDGSVRAAVVEAQQEAEDRVAVAVRRDIAAEVWMMAKAPSGNYDRHLVIDRSSGTRVITDSNIIYGPWLEGTSTRNAKSRFKGFQMFRRIRQAYIRGGLANEIISETVDEYLRDAGAT